MSALMGFNNKIDGSGLEWVQANVSWSYKSGVLCASKWTGLMTFDFSCSVD